MASATRYTVGIDPGTYESGVAVIDNETLAPILAVGAIGPIGTKSNPGPLYGVTRDAWSAIAVAVTHIEKERERN